MAWGRWIGVLGRQGSRERGRREREGAVVVEEEEEGYVKGIV
jgi:hypothetical protein